MNELYEVNPFADIAVGNKPPVISFDPTGPTIQGPIGVIAKASRARRRWPRALAAGVGIRRCEVFERIECAAAQSPAAGDPALVEVSRAGKVTFDKTPPVFEKTEGAGGVQRQGHGEREVQRAG